jgi:hypothetical protein
VSTPIIPVAMMLRNTSQPPFVNRRRHHHLKPEEKR